jgi:hypothetical protein
MKTYGGVDVEINIFLTSKLTGCGQLHAPAALPPGKKFLGTHLIGRWVDPRARLRRGEEKIFWPYRDSNSDPSVVQAIASRYTDCAIWGIEIK